ncbi:hypothetical protein HXX76_005016 [Chlamydomonas incerta]|uniref:AAA+ ATPase domain-containing protein n=1 Tax=Chlamydomonas incerta TaxID=51695 RepID=A0A835W5V3_CHLIN|nr:hypothetical protein HXX76_005016 [Chlamydomonas incerta]|eukprot:KAG2438463.1 hypothetical protein HXX76_005016 [Chlamydomonas incerta]
MNKSDYRAKDIALTAALALGTTIVTGISLYEAHLARQARAAAREGGTAGGGPQRGNKKSLPELESLIALHGLRPDALQFLDLHERLMLTCLVPAVQLREASGEVYGVDAVLDDLKRKLLRPLQLRAWYSRGLWRLPKGVLLHGPPGTGKTSLAKVIAKAGGFRFLHISAASISDKWIGEGPKRVRATFSLARKVAPCVIFVDEVDALLSRRTDSNQAGGHEAYDQVKTEFMALWDGLLSEAAQLSGVVVMGATNRRAALDPAVLRRFTLQYEVPAPGLPQRRAILLGYLRRHVGPVQPDLLPPALMTAEARAALRRRRRLQQEAKAQAEAEAQEVEEGEAAGCAQDGVASCAARPVPVPVSAGASDAATGGHSPSSISSARTSDAETGSGSGGSRGSPAEEGACASTNASTHALAHTRCSTSTGSCSNGPSERHGCPTTARQAAVTKATGSATAEAATAEAATAEAVGTDLGTEAGAEAEADAHAESEEAEEVDEDPVLLAAVSAPGLDWLAAATEGLTGADLRELCHRAALLVLDEVPEERLQSLHPDRGGADSLRPLSRQDFELALQLQSGAPLAE